MKTLRKHLMKMLVGSGVAVGGLCLAYGSGTSVLGIAQAAHAERHPHIRAAIHELREARHELKVADHDFGGHRVEALGSVDQAIKQLELALKFDHN